MLAGFFVIIIGVFTLRNGKGKELIAWIKGHYKQILFSEGVFLVLFAFWTLIRAANPDILGTEKPMELAFISAILKSPQFPPRDPWLSAYAISYYYFGYVMIAMIIKTCGTTAWVGFNLASSLWFALAGTAAFSMIFSLLPEKSVKAPAGETISKAHKTAVLGDLLWSLLGPLFLLFVSNIEGFLEMLHARGIFWRADESGVLQSKFWSWLDIQEITKPPAQPFSWMPERPAGIWWWRASRVLQDYTAAGQSKEVIDEFPFFSFLLSDLHPHVLAIPFVLLATAFALNYYKTYIAPSSPGVSIYKWLGVWFQGGEVSFKDVHFAQNLFCWDFWFLAFLTGSLAFLNTWDFPIYVGLFAAVYTYRRVLVFGWSLTRILEFLSFGILSGILGILIFLPFYFGFSSQAGGFLPSLFYFTRGIHFWIMFLPLLIPIFLWILHQTRKGVSKKSLVSGLAFAVLILGGLWILSYLFGWMVVLLPGIGARWYQSGHPLMQQISLAFQHWGNIFYSVQGITQASDIVNSILLRFRQPGTWITLFILIMTVWMLLAERRKNTIIIAPVNKDEGPADFEDKSISPANLIHDKEPFREKAVFNSMPFVLLLVLLGAGLVIFPEFFYLRDQFGWRINTIFKFYFQTWILWSIAAASASIHLWKEIRGIPKVVFGSAWTFVTLLGLAYPYWGIVMKLDGIQLSELSLNGARNIQQYSNDEMQAIEWLLEAPDGVILEAVGGSYSGFARISAYTGLQTVLGWPGHESQWRGGAQEMGSRETDVRNIYQSSSWEETLFLLKEYEIRYIYVGSYERNAYRVDDNKLDQKLETVFENDSVKIYEFTPVLFLGEQ